MEAPGGPTGEATRDERAKVLRMVRPLTAGDVVRGQFRGYRSEPGVAKDSTVETFAAVRFYIDSWRWAGVPFYIRVGKEMPVTCTEVLITFNRPPQSVFGEKWLGQPNYIRFRVSPEVVIAMGTRAKLQGEMMTGEDVELIARHQPLGEAEPYERLLHDAMRGEPTSFARQDGVEAAWLVVDPILGNVVPVHEYSPKTWGPPDAYNLAPDGGWHAPDVTGLG